MWLVGAMELELAEALGIEIESAGELPRDEVGGMAIEFHAILPRADQVGWW